MKVKVIEEGKYVLECCNDRKDMRVVAKFDGCCDITNYSHGYTCDDDPKDIPDYAEPGYIHICDIREFIAFLTEVADKAEKIEGFDGYTKE